MKPWLIVALAASVLPTSAQLLEPGSTPVRTIKPGETHTYRLHAGINQFLHFSADQHGIDLSLALTGPDGGRLANVNRLIGEGAEDLPWISSTAGEYQLTVHREDAQPGGEYSLKFVREDPTPASQSRFRAFVLTWVEAEALREKGDVASRRSAAAKLEEAFPEWKRAGDRAWEGYARNSLGEIFQRLGDSVRAREALLLALAIRRETGERYGLAVTLNELGLVTSRSGDSRKALPYLEECLKLRRELGDQKHEATTLNNLAVAYYRLGETGPARTNWTQALELRRAVGDKAGEANTLGNLSAMHQHLGELQQALDFALAGLNARRAVGDERDDGDTLHQIGQIYFLMGERGRAKDYYSQADKLYERQGQLTGLAAVRNNLGVLSEQAGDHESAVRYFEQGLALSRKGGNPAIETLSLNYLCNPLLSLGRLDQARESAAQALVLARKTSNRSTTAGSLHCLAKVAASQGEFDQASQHLKEAIQGYRSVNNLDLLSGTLTTLAAVEGDRGNFQAAIDRVQEASAIAESSRARIENTSLRASFRATKATRYVLHADLLMRMHAKDPNGGFDRRAFEVTERSRARSLAEMLSESRAGRRQELTPEQRTREDAALASIRSIQQELFKEAVLPQRTAELKKQLSAAERELELFQLELNTSGSRYGAVEYAEATNVERIQKELLNPDAALIEYAIGEKRSFAWAVTQTGLTSAVLPGRKEIETAIEAYRRELATRVSSLTASASLTRADRQSRQLYQMLIAPFEASLAARNRLVLITDGALAYLPFETLQGKSRMLERFAISYSPSASTLAALRAKNDRRAVPSKTLLAFADPAYAAGAGTASTERGFDLTRLPHARAEVNAIRSLFPAGASQLYIGTEAREQSLKSEGLQDYRYLHFATHGHFDEEQPSRSGIVLSLGGDAAEDGVLQVPEIMRLNLNADLVTLSACQTGLGRIVAGEGVLGLMRAFLYAGTQSVVVSLWNVNDAATSQLMKEFYRNLKAGRTRDEALRQAKLSLLASPNTAWRHPYFWAPFVFVGDAGAPVRR